MATINVGPAATNRASVTASGNTVLDLANAANDTGTITQLDIYVATQTTTTKVGIFYLVSGSTYKCRSATGALGSLAAGLNTITVSLAVQKGDFIGVYHTGGGIDRADSGGTSAYVTGDKCTVDNQSGYTTSGQARIVSVHGTGSTPAGAGALKHITMSSTQELSGGING